MKRILFFASLFFFFSCGPDGKDGKDGKAYLSLWWTSSITLGGFSQLPSTVTIDTYYPHTAGTFNTAWYRSWNNSYWTVNYTITVHTGGTGAKGTLFTPGANGADGADSKFEILLLSTGPSSYQWSAPNLPTDAVAENNSSDARKQEKDLILFTNFVIEETNGNKSIRIEYRGYNVKGE